MFDPSTEELDRPTEKLAYSEEAFPNIETTEYFYRFMAGFNLPSSSSKGIGETPRKTTHESLQMPALQTLVLLPFT